MKTIHSEIEINDLLIKIEQEAIKAIRKNLAFTVEYRDNGITEKQFKAMHVWCRLCAEYLNDKKLYRLSPVSGKQIPWTLIAFKEDVYKVVLAALGKDSTKKQDTIEPNTIRLAISAHMATGFKADVMLPEWPQNKG